MCFLLERWDADNVSALRSGALTSMFAVASHAPGEQ